MTFPPPGHSRCPECGVSEGRPHLEGCPADAARAPLPEAIYEGYWTRLRCDHCDEMFEVDRDVSNGETVTCDACGSDLQVTGR